LIGQCDVRQGPVVLHGPDTHDRYYVLQFVDAWSNNFAYIGRRATGTAEATFLLTDRDHGQADLPVHDLQDQFILTPLAAGTGGAAAEHVAGVPEPDPRVRGSATTFAGGSSSGSPWPRSHHPQGTRRL
jgi:hypothetical protein